MSNALARRDEMIDALRGRLKSIREKSKTEGSAMLRTAEGLAVGYGLGMAEAKWGPDAVWGMNPALAVGVGCTALALLDVGGPDVTPHIRAAGDSALSVFAYTKGFAHQTEREGRAGT